MLLLWVQGTRIAWVLMSMGNVRDEGVGMNEMKERRRADIEGWYGTVVTWSQLANG